MTCFPAVPLRLFPFVALLAVSLACVTPLPRPGATEAVPTPVPTLIPTALPSPTPTEPPATPSPTPTPSPSPEPTATPEPTREQATPTRPITPATATPDSKLEILAPDDGATVPGALVVVIGLTEPGTLVEVQGVVAEVDSQGGFRAAVPLEADANVIEIVATYAEGNREVVVRRVTALALPFLLLITEPENQSVVETPTLPLSGRTGPNAVVSINGRSVPVDRFGYFSASILLEEGPNFIDVVATNDDGRTLSEVVAVIFRLSEQ